MLLVLLADKMLHVCLRMVTTARKAHGDGQRICHYPVDTSGGSWDSN